MNTVSAVITCYNDFKTIERAISSVESQSVKVGEIIVVNDGSDHRTSALLQKISEDGRIKLLNQSNAGVVAARNVGINAAIGSYILSLDSDDYFSEDFVKKALVFLENDLAYGVVTSNYDIYDHKGFVRKHSLEPDKTGLNHFLLDNRIPANALFRKKCWEETGGFDTAFNDGYEDWDFWLGIVAGGWKIGALNEYLLTVCLKTESRNIRAMQMDLALRERIFLKYCHLYQEIYVEFTSSQFQKMRQLLTTLRKRDTSIDMKLGRKLLWPVRMLKNLVTRNKLK